MKNTVDKTNTIKREFLEMLVDERICGNVLAATKLLKRDRSYLYDLKNADPVFSKDWDLAVNLGRKLGIEIAEFGLMDNIKSGNVTAQIFYLKSHLPEVYGEKVKIGGGRDGESPIEHTVSASPELKEILGKIATLSNEQGTTK